MTSFINPKGLDFSFYGFLIASAIDLIVAFTLTWMFGFSDNDVKNVKKAPEKKHLGQQVAN